MPESMLLQPEMGHLQPETGLHQSETKLSNQWCGCYEGLAGDSSGLKLSVSMELSAYFCDSTSGVLLYRFCKMAAGVVY